jgi:hypothetical protein
LYVIPAGMYLSTKDLIILSLALISKDSELYTNSGTLIDILKKLPKE